MYDLDWFSKIQSQLLLMILILLFVPRTSNKKIRNFQLEYRDDTVNDESLEWLMFGELAFE